MINNFNKEEGSILGCSSSCSTTRGPKLVLTCEIQVLLLTFLICFRDEIKFNTRLTTSSPAPLRQRRIEWDRALGVKGLWCEKVRDHNELLSNYVQGVSFNWYPPKNHKFFSVSKMFPTFELVPP